MVYRRSRRQSLSSAPDGGDEGPLRSSGRQLSSSAKRVPLRYSTLRCRPPPDDSGRGLASSEDELCAVPGAHSGVVAVDGQAAAMPKSLARGRRKQTPTLTETLDSCRRVVAEARLEGPNAMPSDSSSASPFKCRGTWGCRPRDSFDETPSDSSCVSPLRRRGTPLGGALFGETASDSSSVSPLRRRGTPGSPLRRGTPVCRKFSSFCMTPSECSSPKPWKRGAEPRVGTPAKPVQGLQASTLKRCGTLPACSWQASEDSAMSPCKRKGMPVRTVSQSTLSSPCKKDRLDVASEEDPGEPPMAAPPCRRPAAAKQVRKGVA
mmetsp:Transcript_85105/g.273991  ORF Transcript_85105/g.273991 Transcript_85105/m.273991 type:complete len:321 (-) Transcript_85105:292-1254(-)